MTGGTAGPGASEQPGELQKSDLAALGRVGRLLFQLPAAGPLCDRGGGGGGGGAAADSASPPPSLYTGAFLMCTFKEFH